MRLTLLQVAGRHTRNAISCSPFCAASIVHGVFVAMLAMGAAYLCDSSGLQANGWSQTTSNIHRSSDRLQVRRIDAGAHPAQMIKIQAFWNRTDMKLIRHAVGACHAAGPSADVDARIPSSINRSSPEPASGFRNNADHFHETRKQWLKLWATGHKTFYISRSMAEIGHWSRYQGVV